MLLEFVYHTYGHHSAGKHIIFVFDVIELGTDFDSRFSKDAQMRIQPEKQLCREKLPLMVFVFDSLG